MVTVGFIDRKELIFDIILFNISGILIFADLTIKLLEIILNCATDNFLLYFRLIPFLQATEVNKAA